jgi:hypothetical protein
MISTTLYDIDIDISGTICEIAKIRPCVELFPSDFDNYNIVLEAISHIETKYRHIGLSDEQLELALGEICDSIRRLYESKQFSVRHRHR